MDRKKFNKELQRYTKGSITRREFLGRTGLGVATAVMASSMPGVMSTNKAHAAEDIGDRVSLATWPNYHDDANLEAFTANTGADVEMNVFGSNEEMLAKLQAGGSGWDVFVPTNYTIEAYVELGLIEALDLSQIPNYDPKSSNPQYTAPGMIDGKVYAVPKNWGTTGFVVNSDKIKSGPTSWADFFEITNGEGKGHTILHDYQLTTIGAALLALGYGFNSVDSDELAAAEALLIESKPNLFAVTSDYQPGMRSGDAWMSICWNGDGLQLNRDMPEMQYILGSEGGELWIDYYAMPVSSENKAAGYALMDHMLEPTVNAKEVLAHGYASCDTRTDALLPADLADNAMMYPSAEALSPLEYSAAETLTSPERAELMARFKSA